MVSKILDLTFLKALNFAANNLNVVHIIELVFKKQDNTRTKRQNAGYQEASCFNPLPDDKF